MLKSGTRMPYDRARAILKNPNASAANLLKAYGIMNMELGRYIATQQEGKDKREQEGDGDADLDFRYMVVIQALEMRINQKFRRDA